MMFNFIGRRYNLLEPASLQLNGIDYSTAGSYDVTLTSVAGCDSIATLNLTINDV
ncbi:MAG: hypothetical protein R2809_02895 [Flavobacteriales bacterium]